MEARPVVGDNAFSGCNFLSRWTYNVDAGDKAGWDDRTNFLLVLTCTIDPSSGWAPPVRSNPEVRLADYSYALRRWLQTQDSRLGNLLLIENSGFCVAPLMKTVQEVATGGKRVELISLDCNHYPSGVHYGYAELAMLEVGIASSTLAKSARYIIKVSGRLFFPALPKLLDSLPSDFPFAVDSRTPWRWWIDQPTLVASQLMIFSTDFWQQHIAGSKSRMGSGISHIEDLIYQICFSEREHPSAILRWKVSCEPIGRAAHWDKDYASFPERSKKWIRAVARRIAPFLWI